MKILLLFLLHQVDLSRGNPKPAEPPTAPLHHGNHFARFPLDCQELWDRGFHSDGEYIIYPQGSHYPVPVYCDMTTNGEVWTVFQKRVDGSVDFNQSWEDYLKGFGSADGEYWLGLQNIYSLTVRAEYELRVDLEDFQGNRVSAKYSNFSLSHHALNAEQDGYRLHAEEFTDEGAGDSLRSHIGQMFSTFDKKQEDDVQNCAKYWGGGFWYHSHGCAEAGLNARYITPSQHRGIEPAFSWITWVDYPQTLKSSQMKMRRNINVS